ncbi:sugar-transfer associated ATP-grasp domain-containing protein [Candidatus Ruminimicrobiellum ovillum]|uniref:sugar-transfer associated ATP-grasp domain-containing protein n=1 Tax=Candidatus Ruminimicrobiellum ovillum TaxID=1947927 RepID=UPI003559662B
MKKKLRNLFLSIFGSYGMRSFIISCSAYIRRQYLYRYFANYFDSALNKNILTKEQKVEIDKFYKENYGKKIDYKWHNLFTMYSGKFDVKYIPLDIFLRFVDKMNTEKNYYEVLKDKNFLYLCADFAGVKTPKRYFYSINDNFFDFDNNIISKESFYEKMSNIGEVFIKPTAFDDSGFARNCRVVNIVNGTDIYSGTSIKDIIEENYKKDFVVQERIVCHKSLSDIYSKSVNTFSVSSLIWNNQIKIINYAFKIGRENGFVDWNGLGSKSLLTGIKDDGCLYDFAFCIKERKKYYAHPDTGVKFKDYKIDLFPKVGETVKKLHSAIPWLKFCSWDITIDKEGTPVVIETEKPVAVDSQLILGRAYFKENTAEILSFIGKNKTNKLL